MLVRTSFLRQSCASASIPRLIQPTSCIPVATYTVLSTKKQAALSSITNRATGVGLSVGVIGISTLALFGSCDIPAYWDALKHSAPILVPITKALVAFPLTYHAAAAYRHLYWDKTAKGLDIPSVELSSKIVIGTSAVLTLLLAFYTI